LTYTNNSNRLATHNGNTVSRDSAGNTTADPTEDLWFTYDDHNRMVDAYVDSVLQASYVYNGQGQRVKKIEATGAEKTIVYHYGLSGELLGETVYSEAGAKIGERDYVWIDSLPIAQSERTFSGSTITSDELVYLHADQLNTPRLATDASGTLVWRWDSDAFGIGEADQDPDSDTEEVNVRLRFPGQYWDDETGLHYNYFRDYDPVTGRYVESDPIGLLAGLNTYVFVGSNPLVDADPSGLFIGSGLTKLLAYLLRQTADEAALSAKLLDVGVGAVAGDAPNCVAGFDIRAPRDALRVIGGAQAIGLSTAMTYGLYGAGATISSLTTAAAIPIFLAGYGGVEIGNVTNGLYERYRGNSIGSDIYDLWH
jgi:RHS repeat-associated protein